MAMAASVEVEVFGGGGGMDCKVVEPVDGAVVVVAVLLTFAVVGAGSVGVAGIVLVEADVSGVPIRVAAPVGRELGAGVPPPLEAVGRNRAIIYYGRAS